MPGVQLLDCSACAGGVCGSGSLQCLHLRGRLRRPGGGRAVRAARNGDVRRRLQDADPGSVRERRARGGRAVRRRQRGEPRRLRRDVPVRAGPAVELPPDAVWRGRLLQQHPRNKLGGAVLAGIPQGTIQNDIQQGIAAGTSGFIIKMLDMASLTGLDDPSLQVGVVRGLPVAGPGYDGAAESEVVVHDERGDHRRGAKPNESPAW